MYYFNFFFFLEEVFLYLLEVSPEISAFPSLVLNVIKLRITLWRHETKQQQPDSQTSKDLLASSAKTALLRATPSIILSTLTYANHMRA
jgi:hypothetical protein